MNCYLFIVEGVHDCALISKILVILGYKEIISRNDIVSPMNKLILSNLPKDEDRLNLYNQIPLFFSKDKNNVCILNANGEQKLLNKLDSTLKIFKLNDMEKINKIVIFCDGDLDTRERKIKNITNKNHKNVKSLTMFDINCIQNKTLKITGVDDFYIPFDFFVFPNNKDKGRLEDVIIESIDLVDNNLLKEVNNMIDNIPSEYKSKWSVNNSKFDKAKISCCGSILCPGVGNSVHIKNNNWISLYSIQKCERLKEIYKYISNI